MPNTSRLVVRRSLVAEAIIVAVCAGYFRRFGTHGVLGIWPAVAPVPAWLVCTLLIPLWSGSDAVRDDPPECGWRTLGSLRLWYAEPDDPALWVRYPRSALAAGSAGFTPNLGIPEGRLVVATFALLIVWLIAVLLLSVP